MLAVLKFKEEIVIFDLGTEIFAFIIPIRENLAQPIKFLLAHIYRDKANPLRGRCLQAGSGALGLRSSSV